MIVNLSQPVSLACHCVYVSLSCECVLWVEALLSVSCECSESRCWREQLFEVYSIKSNSTHCTLGKSCQEQLFQVYSFLCTHRLQQLAQRHTDSNSLPRERATACLGPPPLLPQ